MMELFRPTALKRIFFFVLIDIIISFASLYLAYLLRFNFQIPHTFMHSFWVVFWVLTPMKLVALYLYNNYFIVWRFFGLTDAKNIIKAHVLAYILFGFVYLMFEPYFLPFPRSVIVIDFFLSLVFIGALRVSRRMFMEQSATPVEKPTLILGANQRTGTMIQSALHGDIPYYPVAIMTLKENDTMKGSYINNLKVHGKEALGEIIDTHDIQSVIIAEELQTNQLQELAKELNRYGIYDIKKVKILGDKDEKLEDLSIEDLLARHPQDLDTDTIAGFIKDKKVLITGAGGSIGSEIARQCEKFGAAALTLIDSSEYNLYQIGEQLSQADLKLLNVTDKQGLEKIFAKAKPDIVIHAAAYKHVPICEHNQEIAVKNNVLGTKNVIDVSIAHKVKKVVIISTDKAVRPTNVMGATKRVTELYAQNVEAGETEIVAVRFGNVLGSSGSVIPKFKAQIEAGGPVTVTHPEITRYFMLIPEACQLVLQTAAIARGGELFILDMGEPVKIADLARQMIRLYGKEGEVEIIYTGLRPGEKLYEELLIDESEQKTKYSSIYIARPTHYDIAQLIEDIETLLNADDKVAALQKIVPEFSREDLI
jgi:UDP-N-acetyl-D-glucosamine 4,6-dehydratase